MKENFIITSLAFLLVLPFHLFSQNVGIGTTTPAASAALDVSSTSKGMLVPRITLAQRNAISNPATGLLVFQTDGTVGFYFNRGLPATPNWTIITSGSSNAWSITGNSGTTAASNFIGTTDAQPLLFRVKNQASGIIDSANNNTALGFKSLYSNTTGSFNTANGASALYSNTTGYDNTANGGYALYSNTTGYENTAGGEDALFSNTVGKVNTANGRRALYSNTTGNYNTANGGYALFSNTTGSSNTANGVSALALNTTGYYNTANGDSALWSNTTGSSNTANGVFALFSNTSGYSNVAIGTGALHTNTSGHNLIAIGDSALFNQAASGIDEYLNTAIGSKALYSNTIGYNNTANGASALVSNTVGDNNTANGVSALKANTTGFQNTANGSEALYLNTEGYFNTASGKAALHQNTTGYQNTASGVSALEVNTNGTDNTASGYFALYSNSAGSHNTAIGSEALNRTTASEYNTAVGWAAGSFGYDNGWNNVFLGANTRANGDGYYNVIAIGQDVTCTDNSQVRVGNSATGSIGGQVGWTTLSDERMKTQVQGNVKGLEFIELLHPVTYHLDANKIDAWLRKDLMEKDKNISTKADQLMQKARNEKSKIIYSGFLAQDVEKAARQIGYDFSGVDAPKNDAGLYGLRYAEFVVPLVKAVQELNAKNEMLNAKVDELLKEIDLLKKNINH